MKMLALKFDVGSMIYIGDKIEAKIIAIQINGDDHVSYKVAWFNGNTRCENWVDEIELSSHEKSFGKQIGFHPPKNDCQGSSITHPDKWDDRCKRTKIDTTIYGTPQITPFYSLVKDEFGRTQVRSFSTNPFSPGKSDGKTLND